MVRWLLPLITGAVLVIVGITFPGWGELAWVGLGAIVLGLLVAAIWTDPATKADQGSPKKPSLF